MISIIQQFNLIIGLLALIPMWKLWSQYRRTKNIDFIIFCGVFFSATMGLFGTVLASTVDILFVYQFQYIFLNLIYFLLFLYSYRVLSTLPKSFLIIGSSWFILLIISILFWEKFEQPTSAKVLLWDMPHSFSSYFPNGAGLRYNGTVIYSTGFRLFGDLFRIYAYTINLYVYITVKPVISRDLLRRAKKLWIIATLFLLLYAILILPYLQTFPVIPNLFNLIGLVIISYIAIKIPEGLIISHAQMLRISDLYEIVIKYEGEPSVEQYDSLIAYMKGINTEIK